MGAGASSAASSADIQAASADDIKSVFACLPPEKQAFALCLLATDGIIDGEAKKAAQVEVEKANVAFEIIKRDCEADLLEAIQAIREAESALDVLDKKDISELKALAKPPGGVHEVFAAAMHLMAGYDPTIELDKKGVPADRSWRECAKMMNNPEAFLVRLKGFKVEIDGGRVPQANVDRAKKIKTALGSDFTEEVMRKKSGAAAGLCVFIINIIMYYDIVARIEPKKRAYSAALAAQEIAKEQVC